MVLFLSGQANSQEEWFSPKFVKSSGANLTSGFDQQFTVKGAVFLWLRRAVAIAVAQDAFIRQRPFEGEEILSCGISCGLVVCVLVRMYT
eukprot:5288741-Amphidinium_carterae.1